MGVLLRFGFLCLFLTSALGNLINIVFYINLNTVQCFTGGRLNETRAKAVETVCYGDLGCFTTADPWTSSVGLLNYSIEPFNYLIIC